MVKNSPANTENTRDASSILALGRSPVVGNGTPVFLPGKSHGQRSLVGYSPCDQKELGMTEYTHKHTHTHTLSYAYLTLRKVLVLLLLSS